MFDAIGNMPLHPLVIHAVVISIPLALLLSVLFLVPRTRSWARWALGLVSIGALASTIVAKESGEALQRSLQIKSGNPVGDLIAKHSMLADQLVLLMVVFTVVALANVVLVGRGVRTSDRAPATTDAPSGARKAINLALPVLLVIAAVLVSIWVYRVGDVGSRAVWNPTGTQNYSNTGG